MRALVRAESWPIRGGFRIARGARAEARVVVVELEAEGAVGRGECVPYARYGESIHSVCAQIEGAAEGLDLGNAGARVAALPPGAARNALDCALWDWRAKQAGTPVWQLAGLTAPAAQTATMRTVSVGSAPEMREAALALAATPVIKVKVDGGRDLKRIAEVREVAPEAELVVDANESWSVDQLIDWLPRLPALGVTLLEQPLPSDADGALEGMHRPVPVCADESFHDSRSFRSVEGRYDVVNVKLDKAGGLTEALVCLAEAERRGFEVMLGCMVSTSLAIAPALLLAGAARYVDLDGPLLLESDREGALHDRGEGLLRPSPALWGGA